MKEKKRFNFVKLLIILIILYVVGYFTYKLVLLPVNNIYIENNNYLTDQEVIDSSSLKNYPSFILTPKYKIKNSLLKNNLIKNAKITKSFGRVVTISIEEYTPLFIYKDKTMLDSGKTIDNKYILPIFTTEVTDEVMTKFINKYQTIDEDVRLMISEIKYDPDNIDENRYLFTMNDGNYVYITLYKITAINDYIKIQSTLENNKGILYLDSGNYFEIIN